MGRDEAGLEISNAAASAVAAADHFRAEVLSMRGGAGAVVAAAEENADTPLLQAYAATFFLCGQTRATQERAHTFLQRGAALREQCNPREALFLRAAEAWSRGEHEAALDDLETLCRRWPRDLVAAKVAEFHYYCTGQAWNARRFLRLAEEIAPPNAAQPHFLAMLSFAHELTGDRDAAVRYADEALALEPATPWAHHSLAHAYLMAGDLDTGLRRLSAERTGWQRFGRPIHSHNAWHLALFHLERLDREGVLDIFRNDIWGFEPDLVGEQLDAIALLWRLDLADQPAEGQLWREIASHVLPRAEECFIPFINAHFVYALARAGEKDALDAALSSARAFAAKQSGERALAWAKTGLPLLEGCAALAVGDAKSCADTLGPVLEEVGRVGGSDAQDALFLETHLVALLRCGQTASARRYLQRLRAPRAAPSAREANWRARCS
jgi:tetratricopeptide (TPR) repeat protein